MSIELGIGGQAAFKAESDANGVFVHGPLKVIRHEEIAVGRNPLGPFQETQRPREEFCIALQI